jgi:hypothetical protein
MMIRSKHFVLATLLMAFGAGVAESAVTAGTSLFGRGRLRLSAYGGAAGALDQTYALLGIGAGYFIANGLEVGVDGEGWFGNDPTIYKVTPQIRYVLYRMERLNPYVGAFYRRTMYEGITDLDSYGARVGAYLPLGGRGYAGFGYVFEKLAECDDRIYSSCSSEYPEISFSIGF